MVSKDVVARQLIQEFFLGNEDLNKELEKSAIEEMNRDNQKKEQHSNIGGWQSRRNLQATLGDGSELSSHLIEMFQSFSAPMMKYIKSCCAYFNVPPSDAYDWNYTGAWFNAATRGGYNAPHIHPLNQISAAYYIRTEDPLPEYPFSGRIDFFYENVSYSFFPKPGTLILFPSDMLHFVHPYYGTPYRISLSFNAKNIHTL